MRDTISTVGAFSGLVVSLVTTGCATRPLTVAVATEGHPGYGRVAHEQGLGAQVVAAGNVAYVVDTGNDSPQQDTIWRVEAGGSDVRFCQSRRSEPWCVRVNVDGLAGGTVVVPTESSRCEGKSCGTRAAEHDAAPKPQRGLWIVGGHRAFHCRVSGGVPRCDVAALGDGPVYVRRALAAHEIDRPERADVVWLERGSASGTFWWGAAAGAEGIVRCRSTDRGAPSCALAVGPGGQVTAH
jgi:hypothetical protein